MQSEVLPYTLYDSMDYSSVNSQPSPSGFAHRDAPVMQSKNDLMPMNDVPTLHALPPQGATGGGGGKAVKQKPQEDIELNFEDMSSEKKDISKYNRVSDFWYIFVAVLIVEVIVIFLTRYTDVFGPILNRWYDVFGLSAVLADVLIIVIGFAIGRYVYTGWVKDKFVEGKWSLLYFTGTLVAVQVIHDLLFYFGVINQMPLGKSSMIDIFKTYAEQGSWKILLGDAGMMIASSLLAMELKASAGHIVTSLGLVGLYAIPYLLASKPV